VRRPASGGHPMLGRGYGSSVVTAIVTDSAVSLEDAFGRPSKQLPNHITRINRELGPGVRASFHRKLVHRLPSLDAPAATTEP
jgi:hypothetical protein